MSRALPGLAWMLAGALLLQACADVPAYRRGDTPVLPPTYGEPSATGVLGELPTHWWTMFGDLELDRLVELALSRNTDMRLAAARIDEADAQLRLAGAALWPQIGAETSAQRTKVTEAGAAPLSPNAPAYRSDYRAALTTSFEIDLWGKLRAAESATRAQVLASRHARGAVALSLSANLAQHYFALRALDAQRALARQSLALQDEMLALTRRRQAGGVASDLDVRRAEAARSAVQVLCSQLDQSRRLRENQIGLLTARPGLEIAPRQASAGQGALAEPPVPPVGLPSSLLQARPDIRQAEEALASAQAQVAAVRAQRFPVLSLTGALGSQSGELSRLFSGPAGVFSLGIGLAGPLVDFGRNAAQVDQARARQQQALAVYDAAILSAFRETSDALVNLSRSADIEAAQRERLAAQREAFRIATLRYREGFSPFLDVLDAQRGANEAEQLELAARLARVAATIDLIKAMGGGWKEQGAVPVADGHPTD